METDTSFELNQNLKSQRSRLPDGSKEKRNDETSIAAVGISEAKINGAVFMEITSDNSNAPNVPIESIPLELLATIFQSYVDLNCNPFNLALICHKWRSTALQTRALWRHILVVDTVARLGQPIINGSIPGVNGDFNMIKKWHICATREQLDNAIARAGSVALDVAVRFTQAITGDSSSMNSDAIQMLLSVFGDQGIIARAAKLTITRLPNMPDSYPAWTKLCVPPYLILKTLTCTSMGDKWVPFMGQILSSSPRLASVEIPPSLQDMLKGSQIWGNMKCFYSIEEQISRTSIARGTLIDIILPRCRSIEETVLSSTPWPNVKTTMVSYFKLSYAVLRCELQFMAQLRAPLLTFLSLYELPRSDGQRSDSVQLDMPSLETLSVDTANPSWIYRSKLPRLVSLTMKLTRPDIYLSTYFFIPNGLPTVLNVEIEYLERDLAIISALRSVPNAQTVKIIPISAISRKVTLGHPTNQTLVRHLYAPEPLILVPRGRSIQLGNAQTKFRGSKEALEPLLKALVETRKARGTPLKSVIAHWADLTTAAEYA
ncbi:hypothetical protein FRC15_001439 [Serendipita sp. 397]|nr:hypothetical protein FRC15_001439 [Serendipita sp. 397]